MSRAVICVVAGIGMAMAGAAMREEADKGCGRGWGLVECTYWRVCRGCGKHLGVLGP